MKWEKCESCCQLKTKILKFFHSSFMSRERARSSSSSIFILFEGKENEIKIDKKEKSRDFTKNSKAGVCVWQRFAVCACRGGLKWKLYFISRHITQCIDRFKSVLTRISSFTTESNEENNKNTQTYHSSHGMLFLFISLYLCIFIFISNPSGPQSIP